MPLSEFLRMASRKSGAFPTDLASQSDNDIVELLWENGQITTQGQSSRAARTSPLNASPSNTNKTRTGKLNRVNSASHMSHVVVLQPEMDLCQDNNMAPWFDSLTQDCNSSVFLPENNGMLTQNGFSSVDKRGNLQQSDLGCSKASYSKARHLSSWPPPPPPPNHRQTSDALGSGVLGIVSNKNKGNHSCPNVLFGNPALSRDIGSPTNNSLSYLNFSHFTRPANLLKDGSGTNPKAIKPTLVEGYNSVSSGQPIVAKAFKDSCPSEIPSQETLVMNNDKPYATESAKEVPCRERIVEPVVASSSVGSGNSADRVSFEQTHNSKRKYRDIEDSEGRSEDVEKTTLAGGSGGSKRGRAAEVHNLSERRRRDRINEKMRALQELIPNSNKSDKASMLEEAIEYLKTLQAQVQMLSMGAGLCMPQMMFPLGMPAAAHIPHFSPMGMLDINSGCPVFPAPRFSASLPTNIQGMPSPNLPVYGHLFKDSL